MCVKSECQILAAIVQIRMARKRGLAIDLLSPGGSIIAALMQSEDLTIKDITHLTGISFRSCFNQLSKLENLGIIERRVDPSDKRRSLVKLNQKKLLAALEPPAP